MDWWSVDFERCVYQSFVRSMVRLLLVLALSEICSLFSIAIPSHPSSVSYARNLDLDTATELYLFSWPLVMTHLTRKSMFYCPDNRMMPLPVFPNPNLTAIVKPNVDTLYDACWIDHTKADDLLLTIPNTEDGLYFLFPLMVSSAPLLQSLLSLVTSGCLDKYC
jgi:hypothetical protein